MKLRVTRSLVPNFFTLLNLFMGFNAIIAASNNKFTNVAIFILAASIFDMLDGVMARLIHSTSEFGAELDSLCDLVSFGVAPGFMLYNLYLNQLAEIGIVLSSLPALAGAVRLARFNVQLTSFEDKNFFTGLPIPSSALTLISYIVFIHPLECIPLEYKPILLIAITIIASSSMVSTIKFDNMPRPTKKSFNQRPVVSIIFYIAVIASIVSQGVSIFPFMVFYIVASSLRHFFFSIKATREASDELDDSQELEPNAFDDLDL